ncbi:MAG: hypothetical protein ACYCTB_11720 [bacterium]
MKLKTFLKYCLLILTYAPELFVIGLTVYYIYQAIIKISSIHNVPLGDAIGSDISLMTPILGLAFLGLFLTFITRLFHRNTYNALFGTSQSNQNFNNYTYQNQTSNNNYNNTDNDINNEDDTFAQNIKNKFDLNADDILKENDNKITVNKMILESESKLNSGNIDDAISHIIKTAEFAYLSDIVKDEFLSEFEKKIDKIHAIINLVNGTTFEGEKQAAMRKAIQFCESITTFMKNELNGGSHYATK